jgi:hypothetical protein
MGLFLVKPASAEELEELDLHRVPGSMETGSSGARLEVCPAGLCLVL